MPYAEPLRLTGALRRLQILVIEGLHPFFDDRVADLCDFKIYLDISDEVKFAWKIQRDMAERGHSLESIQASIEARKPDFDAFIDPQKQKADVIIQVRPRPSTAAALSGTSAGGGGNGRHAMAEPGSRVARSCSSPQLA